MKSIALRVHLFEENIFISIYICLNCLVSILGVIVKCDFLNELIKFFNVIYFLSILIFEEYV